MRYAGIDLAWKGEVNPSAMAVGRLEDAALIVESIEPAVIGETSILNFLKSLVDLKGIAIDASLIIPNQTGNRKCEQELNQIYQPKWAGCYPTNKSLYPNAFSVDLSQTLLKQGYQYLTGNKWQLECYPHASLIQIFKLNKRLAYKKGRVADKRKGQINLANLLMNLTDFEPLKLVIPEKLYGYFEANSINELKGAALKTNEDVLDAVVCLYTAALYAINHKGTLFGNINEGFIWVPEFDK